MGEWSAKGAGAAAVGGVVSQGRTSSSWGSDQAVLGCGGREGGPRLRPGRGLAAPEQKQWLLKQVHLSHPAAEAPAAAVRSGTSQGSSQGSTYTAPPPSPAPPHTLPPPKKPAQLTPCPVYTVPHTPAPAHTLPSFTPCPIPPRPSSSPPAAA